MAETFLAQLRRVNTERYEAWVEGTDAGIMFDALELGGEVGELLNVVKKLEREERGWRGSRAAPEDFADECADVMICLDKLARRRGVDLQAATIAKFNATSEKVGLPHRLSTPSPDSGERMREALEPFAGVAVGEVWKHFSAENPTLRISSSDGSRHLTFVSAEWFERARAALQESAR